MSKTRNAKPGIRKAIQVAAGLVFRNGRLLVTQRCPDSHLGGLWEFPGGKREANESFEECLRRELYEELGCEVEVLELVAAISHDYPEKSVHLEFYRCRWVANEPKLIGCADLRWVERWQLAHFEFPAADTRLLDLLQNNAALWE
jgi:8-oxo-dGTP diphosphatase